MLLALVVAICAQDAADYFPLKPGLKWTYDAGDAGEVIKWVGEAEKAGDVECLPVENFGPWGVFRKRTLLAAGSEGIALRKLSKSDLSVDWLRTPLKTGATWKASASLGKVRCDFDFEVLGPEAVEVPAGRYDAIKVKLTFKDAEGSAGTWITWYAKGVGEVQSEFRTERKGRTETYTRKLKKFEGGK